ncbi:MAG: helix-turn-helix domain-containing protein [Candidatus Woesearchaeota archaeon]
MEPYDLEEALEKHVKPIIEETIRKYIGVSIKELNKDITDKLRKNPLLEFEADTSDPLKKARLTFRKFYLERLLKINFGDVTAVARICQVDRKTVHRMIRELRINIRKCRQAMLNPQYVKQEALSTAIEETLKNYEGILHPQKLSKMYKGVGELSSNIMKQLSLEFLPMKEAEHDFERRYIQKALRESGGNITNAARKMKVRFETLHRKIKDLGIR